MKNSVPASFPNILRTTLTSNFWGYRVLKSKPIVSRIRRSRQMMILPGDSNIWALSVEKIAWRSKQHVIYLVIWCRWLLWVLNIVRGRKNLLRLLDGILHLACDKQRCQSCILVVVFGVAKVETKLMEICARCVEGSDRPGVPLARSFT